MLVLVWVLGFFFLQNIFLCYSTLTMPILTGDCIALLMKGIVSSV